MRAPSASFRTELADFRAKLPSIIASEDPAALAQATQTSRRLLDDWENHPDAEKLWREVARHLSGIAPEDFIFAVLTDKLTAEKLRFQDEEFPTLENKYRAYERRLIKQKRYGELAYTQDLLDRNRQLRKKLLSRKKQQAPRQWFIDTWRRRFTEICGQPLDAVVGTLTGIAFDGAVDAGMVRDAGRRTRRRRVTTHSSS